MAKTKFTFIISGFIILFALTFFGIRTVKSSKEKLLSEAKNILNKVAHIDAEKRFYEVATLYVYKVDPEMDSSTTRLATGNGEITFEKTKEMEDMPKQEKEYIVKQNYLVEENPIKVETLDSLFNNTLKEAYSIPFETAIIYKSFNIDTIAILRDSMAWSADTMFYKSALPLEPIHVNIGPIKVLSLEGFIKIPFLYWLTKLKDIIIIFFITCAIYIYIGRKFIDKVNVPPLKVSPRTLQKLSDSLFFDEDKGYLIYENNTIALKDLQLRLFILLLNSPEHFRTYEEMKTSIWNNIDIPQNTVNKTIMRLREKLSAIPIIKLENIRGIGCELSIND